MVVVRLHNSRDESRSINMAGMSTKPNRFSASRLDTKQINSKLVPTSSLSYFKQAKVAPFFACIRFLDHFFQDLLRGSVCEQTERFPTACLAEEVNKVFVSVGCLTIFQVDLQSYHWIHHFELEFSFDTSSAPIRLHVKQHFIRSDYAF